MLNRSSPQSFLLRHLQAIDAWGTVDVLINNAGSQRINLLWLQIHFVVVSFKSMRKFQELQGMVC